MGLGDWYLKALRYQAQVAADPKSKPEKNFLGRRYATSFVPSLEGGASLAGAARSLGAQMKVNQLENLLRNDQGFADGFAAMGDYLASSGQLHLAFLSFSRAIELQHPNTSEMKRRRRELLNHRESVEDKGFRGNSKRMAWWDQEVAAASKKINKGAAWLVQFKKAEAKLVAKKGDTVEFQSVEAALEKIGVKKSRL